MKKTTFCLFFLISFILVQGFALGAVFAKFEGFDGEAQTTPDFSFKAPQKKGPGKLELRLQQGKLSPQLAEAANNKKKFGTVTINDTSNGVKIRLKDVIITSYRRSGEVVMGDIVVLNFVEIEFGYQ